MGPRTRLPSNLTSPAAESDESGGYTVWANALRGCVSEGDTWDEALENIKDAIQCWLDTWEQIERERARRV